jgi:hypothetical protein
VVTTTNSELIGQLGDRQHALELMRLEDLRQHDFAGDEALARQDAAASGERNQPADSAEGRVTDDPCDTDDGTIGLADTHQLEWGEAVAERAEEREEEIARQRFDEKGDAGPRHFLGRLEYD